ncbi:MAG: ABC-F family ATP-binding cassette domain-containing protein, partial [Clostridia bacterium]|nr:ABC-F family ATP-binding cassette domain-containing protein [Clostridia bacterium]
MPLISASNIKKSFVERLLFENITFDVNEKDRIGLVGVNGCGKTTLFRILCGTESADEGSVYRNSLLRIGVMNQNTDDFSGSLYDYVLCEFAHLAEMENSLDCINSQLSASTDDDTLSTLIKKQANIQNAYEQGGGLTYKSRTRSVLLGLGFTESELSQPLCSMSGGQKNKAQLARLLLSEANLLLLDEPTNHLDIEAVTWLEDYLCNIKAAYIVISHDRYFLDKVTNKTLELKNSRMKMSQGNYTRHTELCSTQREAELRKYRRTQKEIRRIEGIVEQQKRWGKEHNFITAASKQ